MGWISKVILALMMAGIISVGLYGTYQVDERNLAAHKADREAIITLDRRIGELEAEVGGMAVAVGLHFKSIRLLCQTLVGAVVEQKELIAAQQAKIEALEARKECTCGASQHKQRRTTPSCTSESSP